MDSRARPADAALAKEAEGETGTSERQALAEAVHLLGVTRARVVRERNGACAIGYQEGRDVTVFAAARSWGEVVTLARERVLRVDDMVLRQPGTGDATIATAASVPLRFVRLRRRDLAPPSTRAR